MMYTAPASDENPSTFEAWSLVGRLKATSLDEIANLKS